MITNTKQSKTNNSKESTINNTLKEQPESTFIKTPEWLRPKRSVLYPNSEDNRCFQYSVTLCLYHKQIGKTFCRISVIKPFINNLIWENINFPPQTQDNQQIEINNKSIALNILQIQDQEKISLNTIKPEKIK